MLWTRRASRNPAARPQPSANTRATTRSNLLVAVIGAVALIASVAIPLLIRNNSTATGDPLPAPPSPSVAPAPSGEAPPFTVAVRQIDDYCRQGWLVPKDAADLVKDDRRPDWLTWAAGQGGVRADRHEVEFTLQGLGDAAVTISKVRVVYAQPRSSPIAGTLVRVACGEGGAYRFLRADLDTDPPTITSEVSGTAEDLPFEGAANLTPLQLPYRVSLSDPESFVVQSVVSRYDVHWYVAVDWQSQSLSGTVLFGDGGIGGPPFRTMASSASQARCEWREDGTLNLPRAGSIDCPA